MGEGTTVVWNFNSDTSNLCALLAIEIEILQFSRLERWFTFCMVFMHIVFKLYFTEEKKSSIKTFLWYFFQIETFFKDIHFDVY